MSLEQILAENTASNDKLTAMISELLPVMKANTDIMTKLNDGRAEAVATLTEAEAAAPKTRRTRTTKAAEAEPEPTTEDEPAEPAEPAKKAWTPDITEDGLRGAFSPYLTGFSGDDDKNKRIDNVKAILTEVGAEMIVPTGDKKGIESDDDKRRALFFLARFSAGLPVDFKADYDFDADPLDQSPAAAPAEADLVG